MGCGHLYFGRCTKMSKEENARLFEIYSDVVGGWAEDVLHVGDKYIEYNDGLNCDYFWEDGYSETWIEEMLSRIKNEIPGMKVEWVAMWKDSEWGSIHYLCDGETVVKSWGNSATYFKVLEWKKDLDGLLDALEKISNTSREKIAELLNQGRTIPYYITIDNYPVFLELGIDLDDITDDQEEFYEYKYQEGTYGWYPIANEDNEKDKILFEDKLCVRAPQLGFDFPFVYLKSTGIDNEMGDRIEKYGLAHGNCSNRVGFLCK